MAGPGVLSRFSRFIVINTVVSIPETRICSSHRSSSPALDRGHRRGRPPELAQGRHTGGRPYHDRGRLPAPLSTCGSRDVGAQDRCLRREAPRTCEAAVLNKICATDHRPGTKWLLGHGTYLVGGDMSGSTVLPPTLFVFDSSTISGVGLAFDSRC